MPTVKINDINLYYETHGQGEAVVLISGYGGNSHMWYQEIPTFSTEFTVVAFDNRGTGRSDKPDIPYSMEIMSGDVARLLEATGIGAAHIYGVSMGGMIAQEFTLRYPEKVISLILGCTNCGGSHAVKPDRESMTFLFDAERMRQLTPEEATRQSLDFLWSRRFIEENADIVDKFIARRLEYVTPLHGYLRQAQAIAGHDTYDRLPQITAPTLVIAGSADRLVPVENSRILASSIPNAELVILDDMGHGYPVEAAQEANQAILDFLRRHRCSRRA